MEKKYITLKTSEEVENMNVNNTSVDVSLRERFISISNLINQLKAEKDKITSIVLDKYEHKPVKTGEIFKAIVYDSYSIDENKLIELIGKEKVESVKTKVKHTEYIKA